VDSITDLNFLNLKPTIIISHKGLEAIKRIVSIAPQEAQWFHTVDCVSSADKIELHLSEKLYIPKQNTSVAQVDTTSSMMMDFYRDLQEDYQDQELVNEKLSSMTCWCHSHHNMSPAPSSQDDRQFNTFVSSSIDQNQKSWQIMLIFNKNEKFYSRVYDPNTGVVIEGVPITLKNDYDFSYIETAAKTKFIYPKKSISFQKKIRASPPPGAFDLFAKHSFSEPQYSDISSDAAVDLAYELYPSKDILDTAKLTTKTNKESFFNSLSSCFELKELEFFYLILTRNKQAIFDTILIHDEPTMTQKELKKHILDFMSSTTYTVKDITKYLKYTFESEETFSAIEFKLLVERALND
jgi:hypothetical protein